MKLTFTAIAFVVTTSLPLVANASTAACKAYEYEIDGCSSAGAAVDFLSAARAYAPLRPACVEHDKCYQTIGYTKKECDVLMLSESRKICLRKHPGPITAAATAVLQCAAGDYNDNAAYRSSWLKNQWERSSGDVYEEVLRADDNLKNYRDALVDNVIDGVDTVVEVLETVPGVDYVFDVIGHPSNYIRCAVDGLSFVANNAIPDNSEGWVNAGLSVASGAAVDGAPLRCLGYSETMFQGVRLINSVYGDKKAPDEIYDDRQEELYRVAAKLAEDQHLPDEEKCSLQAEHSNLFREVVTIHDAEQTIERLYELAGLSLPGQADINRIISYGAAHPENWQLELIYQLKHNPANPVEQLTDSGPVTLILVTSDDMEGYEQILRDYHRVEMAVVKGSTSAYTSRFIAAVH